MFHLLVQDVKDIKAMVWDIRKELYERKSR